MTKILASVIDADTSQVKLRQKHVGFRFNTFNIKQG